MSRSSMMMTMNFRASTPTPPSFRYARLQRMHEEIPTGYDDASARRLRRQCASWAANGGDAYIFMINGAKVRAPAAALALQAAAR